jgi:hypothetical protein
VYEMFIITKMKMIAMTANLITFGFLELHPMSVP